MRRQSAKARKVAATRKDQRFGLLEARGAGCQGCPVTPVGEYPPRPWSEVHEILTRGRGGDPTDPENQLCLCGPCHSWITTHETDARELGLVRGRAASEHRAIFRPWEQPHPEPEL